MKSRVFTLMIAGLLGLFLSTLADADYDDYADRLSREHRVANEVDEWIERGSATITASPLFDEGVRLTAWESSAQNADDYEFAIASAVYLFEIPRGTQSIEILVRYRGEPRQLEIEDYEEPIAGRVWIRNTKRELTRRGYHDKNAEETRYGDTFVLRAKNRSERIKIPAAGHVKDGWMELHVVAEGGEQLDVEYIEVSAYHRQPKVRVIQRYLPTYRWRPWHRYTYLYFYDGPIHYATDFDYYYRWNYPIYEHRYLAIRSSYGGYLGRYRGYYPSAYYRCYSPYYGYGHYGYKGTPKVYQRRTQLNRWSKQHETTRRQYTRSRLATNNGTVRQNTRKNIRTALENHRRQTPATTQRVARESIISQKRRAITSAQTLQRSKVRQRSYSANRTLSKQRRYPSTTTTFDANRYRRSTSTRETRPLYRRSTTSSPTRSYSSSSTSSRSELRTKQRRSTTSSTRARSSVSRSSSTKSRVSRSASSTSRTRPTTSSSSSRTRSSSSSDDDEQRSRTTQRTKRRR